MTARIVWPNMWWNRSRGGDHFGVPSEVLRALRFPEEPTKRRTARRRGERISPKRAVTRARFRAWSGPLGSGGVSGRRLEPYVCAEGRSDAIAIASGRFTHRGLLKKSSRQDALFVLLGGALTRPPQPLGAVFLTTFDFHFDEVRCPARFWTVSCDDPDGEDDVYLRWTFELARDGRERAPYVGLGRVRRVKGDACVIDWAEWRAPAALCARWLSEGVAPPDGPAHVGSTQAGVVAWTGWPPAFASAPWGMDEGLIWRRSV